MTYLRSICPSPSTTISPRYETRNMQHATRNSVSVALYRRRPVISQGWQHRVSFSAAANSWPIAISLRSWCEVVRVCASFTSSCGVLGSISTFGCMVGHQLTNLLITTNHHTTTYNKCNYTKQFYVVSSQLFYFSSVDVTDESGPDRTAAIKRLFFCRQVARRCVGQSYRLKPS